MAHSDCGLRRDRRAIGRDPAALSRADTGVLHRGTSFADLAHRCDRPVGQRPRAQNSRELHHLFKRAPGRSAQGHCAIHDVPRFSRLLGLGSFELHQQRRGFGSHLHADPRRRPGPDGGRKAAAYLSLLRRRSCRQAGTFRAHGIRVPRQFRLSRRRPVRRPGHHRLRGAALRALQPACAEPQLPARCPAESAASRSAIASSVRIWRTGTKSPTELASSCNRSAARNKVQFTR